MDIPRKLPSKFKPALAGPSAQSSAVARSSKSIPLVYPHKKPMSSSASSPMKRLSSGDDHQGPLPKRFRPAIAGIERTPCKSLKAQAPTRHYSSDRGETSSEVDSPNLGLSTTKTPTDSFKFSRMPPPSFPSPSRSLSAHNHKHTPQMFTVDLTSKSLDELKALLSVDQEYHARLSQWMFEYIQSRQGHDIIILSHFLSQLDDRIRAITDRITSLDTMQEIEHPPPPLDIPLSMSDPVALVEPADNGVGDRRTPPPSDHSSTTIDTITADSAPQGASMLIDSPEVVEMDSHDMSVLTLVVGDSDDAYYDKFDTMPDDLAFLDTDKTQVNPSQMLPSQGTSASSSTSTVVVPFTGGRIDHTSSPYYKEVISILKNTFKLSTFRTNQLECIVATLDSQDVFYLAPTGGGKSLCFQLPALCVTGKTQGTTFVISPLISLITDQVSALRRKGIAAFPLTSAAEENEVRQAMRMMRSNVEEKPKLVYTTPERLQKSDCLKDVVDQLYQEKQLARFVIDEAHVIGSWGRDFRASYAGLNVLRKNWPSVPIMALTGSANKDAIEDIKHNLAMRNPVCLAQSFNRPNLHYSVSKKPALKKDLVQSIAGFVKTHHPNGTGIIYVLSRAESEEMAQKLREEWGIEARHYHAGIDNEERKVNQDDWMTGKCKVIVATIAFGMGIDKPDVRFVIHATLSKDMDGYYQETGRAGRDGKSSDCLLFYTYSDAVKIEKMLRNPNNDPSRNKPSDAEIERQVTKLQGVVAYCCNESDCRRVLILRHFDEEFSPEDCHNQCDNCHRPGTLTHHDFTTEVRQVIQLLQEMVAINSRGVTQSQLKDTWKGKNNKAVQPYKGTSLYASGKALSHPTVERIFNHLATEGIISMYRVQSSSGYSNTYIQLGGAASDYLDGGKRLVLSWKEKEGDVPKGPVKKTVARSSPRKKGKEPVPSLYLNLYEDIEDADYPSDLEDPSNAIDNAEPTTSRIPYAGTSRPTNSIGLQNKLPAVCEDDPSVRLERLKEARDLIAGSLSKLPDDVLQDDTLQVLALTNPKDARAFRDVLVDYEDPNEVISKWEAYGQHFLNALREPRQAYKRFDSVKLRRDFAFNG